MIELVETLPKSYLFKKVFNPPRFDVSFTKLTLWASPYNYCNYVKFS